jgi:hypothetical protein
VFVTCALSPAACRHDRGPDLQIVGESVRVRSGDTVPHSSPFFDGQRVALVAARREVLGIQVLHRGGGPVTLSIDGARVTGFAVEPVHVARPSTGLYGGSHGAGDYPDVLVADSAPATNPAYFEIVADAAGVHAGKLVVAGKEIPVSLAVMPLALPDVTPRVWAYEDPRELGWAGLGNATVHAPSAAERACIAMFREHGVLLSPDLPADAWAARKDLLAGAPYVPALLPEDPAAVGDAVRAWVANTQGTGQVPFAIPIDEPRKPEARAKVRELAAAARAAGAGPGQFLYAVTDEPRTEYGGMVDLSIHLRPKRSDTFTRWTYNGAPPHAGSMVADAASPGMRTWGWIGERWNIPVWYVWDALYWHDRHNRKGAALPGRPLDWHHDAASFDDGDDHGNLDGVLALPGTPETPCLPTLRLAALRRGQQDRTLIELAMRCKPTETAALVARLVPRALGDASDDADAAWPSDEKHWETARQELLELADCGGLADDLDPALRERLGSSKPVAR